MGGGSPRVLSSPLPGKRVRLIALNELDGAVGVRHVAAEQAPNCGLPALHLLQSWQGLSGSPHCPDPFPAAPAAAIPTSASVRLCPAKEPIHIYIGHGTASSLTAHLEL